MTAKTVKAMAQRLEKAEQLVAEGAVFPISGREGCFVVKNGDGTQFYGVCVREGRESCSCPDYEQRQRGAGLPCKHLMAVELFIEAQGTTPEPTEPETKTFDTSAGVALLMAAA